MIVNEKQMPYRFYARHIKEGVVRYVENGKDVLYLVTNEALKKMNPSFEGKPIYVFHVDKVDLDNLRETADGYVVKSFYNEFDGAWWLEGIAVSDKAFDAIKKGWGVSNAYTPTELGNGGVYHNIDYSKEVLNGVYEHLAIVNNPRYEEACIMTPDEYKDYNQRCKQQLEQLKNSKENEEMALTDEDIKKMADVLLPQLRNSVEEVVEDKLKQAKKNAEEEDHRRLLREADAIAMKPVSDFDGGEEEKFRTLTKKLEELGYSRDLRGNKKENEVETPTGDEDATHERKDIDLENACKNEEEEETKEEKKENSKGYFSFLKNAKANAENSKPVVTTAAGILLGKQRYGKK